MNLNQAEALEVSRDPFHTALDPSDILLTGQAAIVTGGGGGIGQGIALGLAKFGADVAVLDIDPERGGTHRGLHHRARVATRSRCRPT